MVSRFVLYELYISRYICVPKKREKWGNERGKKVKKKKKCGKKREWNKEKTKEKERWERGHFKGNFRFGAVLTLNWFLTLSAKLPEVGPFNPSQRITCNKCSTFTLRIQLSCLQILARHLEQTKFIFSRLLVSSFWFVRLVETFEFKSFTLGNKYIRFLNSLGVSPQDQRC